MLLRWQPFGREGRLKSMPKHGFLTNKCHSSSKFSRKFETLPPPFSDFTLSKPSNSLENLKARRLLTTIKELLPVGFRSPKDAERLGKATIKSTKLADCRCTKRKKCAVCAHTCVTLVSPVPPSKTGYTPSVYRHCVTVSPCFSKFRNIAKQKRKENMVLCQDGLPPKLTQNRCPISKWRSA